MKTIEPNSTVRDVIVLCIAGAKLVVPIIAALTLLGAYMGATGGVGLLAGAAAGGIGGAAGCALALVLISKNLRQKQ
jgi:hypothetical protein